MNHLAPNNPFTLSNTYLMNDAYSLIGHGGARTTWNNDTASGNSTRYWDHTGNVTVECARQLDDGKRRGVE